MNKIADPTGKEVTVKAVRMQHLCFPAVDILSNLARKIGMGQNLSEIIQIQVSDILAIRKVGFALGCGQDNGFPHKKPFLKRRDYFRNGIFGSW